MKLHLREKLDRLNEQGQYSVWRLRKSSYRLVRAAYRRLPPRIRRALQGQRVRFVRWAKTRAPAARAPSYLKSGNAKDVSWDEFCSRVLSYRERFKGIFIQENGVGWDIRLYQRPQHICSALGRAGYLVIYRIDDWCDDDVNGFREVSENVWITNMCEVDRIEGAVRSFYSTSCQLSIEGLERYGRNGVLVYEYIDHIDEQISGDSVAVDRLLKLKEFAFSGGVDFVVASSKELENEAISALGRDKVVLVPNGVDTEHYRRENRRDTVLPEVLVAFNEAHSNTVGYFGAIAPWLWFGMLSELANLRPEVGFVFIGPDYSGSVGRLPKSENVLYLGEVDYRTLPAYAYTFDICFIPFAPGDIARTTSPLKLFEYFALEKPVVVTADMLECIAFDVVFAGNTAAQLSRAIDDAIDTKSDPLYLDRLRRLADENDWNERVRAMGVLFDALPRGAWMQKQSG